MMGKKQHHRNKPRKESRFDDPVEWTATWGRKNKSSFFFSFVTLCTAMFFSNGGWTAPKLTATGAGRPACHREEEGRPSACGLQSAAKKSLPSRRDRRPGSSLPLALGLGSSEQSPPGHTQHHAAGGGPAPAPDPPSPELELSLPWPEPSGSVSCGRLLPPVSSTTVTPRQQAVAAAGSPSRMALATAFPCFLRLHSFLPPPASSSTSSPLPDEEEDGAAGALEVEGEDDEPGCLRRRRSASRPPSPPPPLARLRPSPFAREISSSDYFSKEMSTGDEVAKEMSIYDEGQETPVNDISCVTELEENTKYCDGDQPKEFEAPALMDAIRDDLGTMKSVKDVGVDSSPSPIGSPHPKIDFEKKQQQIIELWHECNVSIVHRTYFFLLFKGDPADNIYIEVEHRRLSFIKSSFSAQPTAEGELNSAIASSLKNLRRERDMLHKQMLKKLNNGEKETVYSKWGIDLSTKQRRLQLSRLIWTQTGMDHVRQSAALVAKLIDLLEPEQALKEMFGMNFTLAPRADRRSFGLSGSYSMK